MSFTSRFTRLSLYARGQLRGYHRVRIGPRVKLGGPGTYDLRPGSAIRAGTRIWVGPGATLTLERGSAIGANCVVNVETGIHLGPGSQVSWGVQLLDTDFHAITDDDGVVHPHTSPIVIGAHVLVGTGVMILKGVSLGDGSIVAAGSVVTRSVEPGVVVGGNPARPIGRSRDWN